MCFFCNATLSPVIYTLSLHDALPISGAYAPESPGGRRVRNRAVHISIHTCGLIVGRSCQQENRRGIRYNRCENGRSRKGATNTRPAPHPLASSPEERG